MDSPSTAALAVTATFTAEPLREALEFWMRELEVALPVTFAPYHQVFQQLLDPASLVRRNRDGMNVVLLRFEDWRPDRAASADHGSGAEPDGVAPTQRQTSPDAPPGTEPTVSGTHPAQGGESVERDFSGEVSRQMQANAEDFVRAMKAAVESSGSPYLVCICPESPATAGGQVMLYRQMEEQIAGELGAMNTVYFIRAGELMTAYPVAAYYDAHGDRLGHVPYTPVFFAALGTIIARRYHAIRSSPYKVIVLDCDQTLWKGVCGEDGPLGIEVDSPRRRLQEFMVRQSEAGMLLCLCSRNNEEEVMQVFEHHPEMPLQRRHLVSWRINWREKSENLRALAEELRLGLDSFIFLDDDPVQCAEVGARCPEVLTLSLPDEPEQIPEFLAHVWAFDHRQTTGEDRSRTRLYQENVQRERFREKALTFADFLAGLDLRVTCAEAKPAHWARVAQLTQRTNQFNFTTIRRAEEEIRALCETRKLECLVAEAGDRFGDYGLVGVVLFAAGAEALQVDTFLLSCRALGRGIEHQMMATLGRIAQERGLARVEATGIPSGRNQPALAFLQEIGASYAGAPGQGVTLPLPAERARAIVWHPGSAATLSPREEVDNPKTAGGPGRSGSPARLTSAQVARIARTLSRPGRIRESVAACHEQGARRLSQPYVAPGDELEQMVVDVWQEVLRVPRVGLDDNFLELGGDSLLAVQILSRLSGLCQAPLSLRTLFDAPTAGGLARHLRQRRASGADPARRIAALLEQVGRLSHEEVQQLMASACQDAGRRGEGL